MSDDIRSVSLTPVRNVSGNIGAGSFIINDYLLTLTESTGGYSLDIKKGSQTQTAFIRDAVSIESIDQIAVSYEDGGTNTIRIILSDGTYYDFDFYNGHKGDPGLTQQEHDTIINAENNRIAAENTRASNETIRVQNESSRASAETTRVGNENTRIGAESQRVTAESNRSSQETIRISNENTRKANESTRVNEWNSLKIEINNAIATTNSLNETVGQLSTNVQKAYEDVVDEIDRAEDVISDVEDLKTELSNISATASQSNTAFASYSNGVFTFGIPKGDTGDAFHIVKTYSSIIEMNADYSGTDVAIGEFVMITSNVEDPDNAKVYVKGDQQYNFVVDMSGSAGIQGVGISSVVKTATSGLIDTYTITFTDGNTTTFNVNNGADGFSPTVAVSTITGGHRIVVTDKNGTQTFDVLDGQGAVQDVQINGTSILNNGVANVPIAGQNDPGVVKYYPAGGVSVDSSNRLVTNPPSDQQIKEASSGYRPIVPSNQHKATFYGLATAAGDNTQKSSSNPIGTYTDTAKSAIRSMLGATSDQVVAVQDETPTDPDTKLWIQETPSSTVHVPTVAEMNTALSGKVSDVQVNGTSVVTNGVANVPVASSSAAGVVYINSARGIDISTDGSLKTTCALTNELKSGVNFYKPVVSSTIDAATFYGLAKAAGDSTQSSSSNAVGTYTENAKSAIQTMLTAPESVSGSTPSITAKAGVRYVCGEVTTLDITLPASGCFDVVFESGSTPTVLTASGVTWPDWFDPTALEANRTYEINIADGFGAVMSWA